MRTVHRTDIVARCPLGGTDIYEASFTVAGTMLLVEDIQRHIDHLTAEPIYQEELTGRLAVRLKCRVETIGRHGRFTTECVHEPQKEVQP